MNFLIEQHLNGPMDAVQSVLFDPDFVAARSSLPKLGDAELLESSRDGSSGHQRIRLRFTAPLSSAVTAVIDPSKLTWVDDATYDLVAHIAEHQILPDNYADRLSCSYRALLEARDGGTHRSLDGVMKVRMPLVGGKVERAIVSGLEEHADAEAVLINEFLAR
jgi:hypothetical protein